RVEVVAWVANFCMVGSLFSSSFSLSLSAFPTREKLRCLHPSGNNLVAQQTRNGRSEQGNRCNETARNATPTPLIVAIE
ncbi:hypothetical protein, partial [Streptomyces sp. NPDC101115]|uniref:hypothetical protein n=1 Tax=Streptomyces sp. NPDC101115 TaxID=3366106 RepID=UPI0038065B26